MAEKIFNTYKLEVNSIERKNVLETINLILTRNPHLRFGQFINNFTHWVKTEKENDLFYLQDGEIVKLLFEYESQQ